VNLFYFTDFEETVSGESCGSVRSGGLKKPTNLVIPLEPDETNQVSRFFVLDDTSLPEDGQQNLLDLIGRKAQEGLAGMVVQRSELDQALQESYNQTLLKAARSIDACDEHTHQHSLRTSYWSWRLAQSLFVAEDMLGDIALAGRLHDVGKVNVARQILTKPGPLNAGEWEVMKTHPSFAAMIFEPSEMLKRIAPWVRHHHENYNGSGYPDGLAGDAIPLGARIISVADAFATMVEGRVYKPKISMEAALGELVRCQGTQFDPVVVDALRALFEDGVDNYCPGDRP
jgi:HD-GYP domain-containing protein (c-di-GMP phosphodiesterase class II)